MLIYRWFGCGKKNDFCRTLRFWNHDASQYDGMEPKTATSIHFGKLSFCVTGCWRFRDSRFMQWKRHHLRQCHREYASWNHGGPTVIHTTTPPSRNIYPVLRPISICKYAKRARVLVGWCSCGTARKYLCWKEEEKWCEGIGLEFILVITLPRTASSMDCNVSGECCCHDGNWWVEDGVCWDGIVFSFRDLIGIYFFNFLCAKRMTEFPQPVKWTRGNWYFNSCSSMAQKIISKMRLYCHHMS